jgi:acyl carrier protein
MGLAESRERYFWIDARRCTMKSKSIMNDLRQRLAQCFSLVFPDIEAPEVYSASSSSVAAWDSLAAIILANVIEEEFRVKLDYDVLPELVSFDLILNHLNNDHLNNDQLKSDALKNNHGIS